MGIPSRSPKSPFAYRDFSGCVMSAYELFGQEDDRVTRDQAPCGVLNRTIQQEKMAIPKYAHPLFVTVSIRWVRGRT